MPKQSVQVCFTLRKCFARLFFYFKIIAEFCQKCSHLSSSVSQCVVMCSHVQSLQSLRKPCCRHSTMPQNIHIFYFLSNKKFNIHKSLSIRITLRHFNICIKTTTFMCSHDRRDDTDADRDYTDGVVMVQSWCSHGVVTMQARCSHDYTYETYRAEISTKT